MKINELKFLSRQVIKFLYLISNHDENVITENSSIRIYVCIFSLLLNWLDKGKKIKERE